MDLTKRIQLRLEIKDRFKELLNIKEEGNFDKDELNAKYVFCVLGYMSLLYLDFTETNAMKVHNNFNAYQKEALRLFKKQNKQMASFSQTEDNSIIQLFNHYFKLHNLDDFGNQKILTKDNLEKTLLAVHKEMLHFADR